MLRRYKASHTTQRFAEYAYEVARRFGNRIDAIATHNEPWCTANLGYGNAQFAPGVADARQAIQVSHHLLLSHGLGIKAMREAGALMGSRQASPRSGPARPTGSRCRRKTLSGAAMPWR